MSFFCNTFCPFTHLTNQKIKTLIKWKNVKRNYHFTHVYHKWKLCHVWSLRYGERHTHFFAILGHFLPLTPLTTQEIYISVGKIMIISCNVSEIWCVTNAISIFYFGLFSALLPPNSPKKQNFKKMKKKTPADITILHMCTKNYDQMILASWDTVPNGQTVNECPT